MWVRVTHDSQPKYRLIHLETGNRIEIISNNSGYTLNMYVSHGTLPNGNGSRPDMDVHDLAKGSQAECIVVFETLCNNLAALGHLTA